MKNTNRSKTSTSSMAGIATAVVLAASLAGCVSQSPNLDANFGNSLEKAKQAQRIEPTPAQRQSPPPAVTSTEVQRAITVHNAGLSGIAPTAGQGAAAATGNIGLGSTAPITSTPSNTIR